MSHMFKDSFHKKPEDAGIGQTGLAVEEQLSQQTAGQNPNATDKGALLRFLLPLLLGAVTMGALRFVPAGGLLSALCALISPVLLLYGVRRANSTWQVIVSGLVFATALTAMNAGYCPTVWLDLVVFFLSAAWMFPAFLIERCHLEKGRRFFTTVVFPTCWVALFQLSTLIYVGFQYRLDAYVTYFSVLTQTASLFGTSGLLFAMLWSASVIVYVVENRRAFSRIGVAIWAVLLTGCIVFGVIRVNKDMPSSGTVRVAYTTSPYNGDFVDYENLPLERYAASAEQSVRTAAEQGAEVLIFNEEAFCIDDSDEEKLCDLIKSLATEYNIHILAGAEISDTNGDNDGRCINCIAWVTPAGEVLFRYVKHSLVPVVESFTCTQGTKDLPSATVRFACGDVNVAAAICFDSNFSTYIYSLPADTQLMFLPSWDWSTVTDFHAEIARLLTVENGVTLLKDTYDGSSNLYSPLGETLYTTSTATDGYETVHVVDAPIYTEQTVVNTVWQYFSGLFSSEDDDSTASAAVPEETDAYVMPNYMVFTVACDAVSIIVMGIILYGLIFENSERDKKTLYFELCCVCTILALAADIPAWYFESRPGHDAVLYISNWLTLVISLGTVAFIPFYEIEIIGRRNHISGIHAAIITFACVLAALMTTVGVFIGTTFTVENGVFTYGTWYIVPAAVSLAMLIYMEILAILKRKYLGRHDTLAFLCYMVLPLAAVAMELINPNINLTLPATALSSLLLYVMLQSGNVSALHLRSEQLNELSYRDMLTGLNNRRAFDEAIARLEGEAGLNVVFCDVNGLKYTNDTLGHIAGDELLKRFAKLLQKHFSSDSLFRISGDEFAILVPKLSENAFNARVDALKVAVAAEGDIAALGTARGIGRNAHQLLIEAENRMYADKDLCRARHPEFKR